MKLRIEKVKKKQKCVECQSCLSYFLMNLALDEGHWQHPPKLIVQWIFGPGACFKSNYILGRLHALPSTFNSPKVVFLLLAKNG